MASPAKACLQALRDATARWGARNRASDGIMGDPRHQKIKSDHNDGNAFDLTHDPKNGVDCEKLSRLAIKDTRVTYVIWNSQINVIGKAVGWHKYVGSNPHTKHMHVSIKSTARDDNKSPWPWSPGQPDPYNSSPASPRIKFYGPTKYA